MDNKECMNDEEFVGNIYLKSCSKRFEIFNKSGLKYRLGIQAYDIHGKIISKERMLPLFIKCKSLKIYDDLMSGVIYDKI